MEKETQRTNLWMGRGGEEGESEMYERVTWKFTIPCKIGSQWEFAI